MRPLLPIKSSLQSTGILNKPWGSDNCRLLHPSVLNNLISDAGQLVALMVPSGDGNSSLLYSLMGTASYGASTGRMWVNTRPMRLARLRRIMGYVPQVGRCHSFMVRCRS